MARSPFPLAWPEGIDRKHFRESSDFHKERGFNAARDGALNQLRLMRASHVVITSNLPTNSKGHPTSVGSGRLDDPGIAIYWVKQGKEFVLACDRWRTCVENMRAIEKTLEAIRGIERWGSTDMVDRAFAGFAALPPGSSSGESNGVSPQMGSLWREVLRTPLANYGDLRPAEQLAVAKLHYREEIKRNHPDYGGNDVRAAQLNAAMAAAEKELMKPG